MADNLISLETYKSYVGINSENEDTVIELLIPRVSAFVKNYCKRTLIDYAYETKIEVSNGGVSSILVDEPPILTLTGLDYSSDYGQTYTPLVEFTDWVADGDVIVPIGREEFAKQLRGYRVTYTGGYEDLPDDLIQAVTDLITYYRKNDGTVHATKFSNTNTMQIEHISDAALPAYIKRVLDMYVLDYS